MSETRGAASAPEVPPRWLEEMCEAAGAIRELAQAQWQLLGAELRLARTAARVMLATLLLATVGAVALGLTLLALLGLALAQWLGSWTGALLVLAGLLVLGLTAACVLLRRCLHWLSLPGTRAQWRPFTRSKPAPSRAAAGSNQEASPDDVASQAD